MNLYIVCIYSSVLFLKSELVSAGFVSGQISTQNSLISQNLSTYGQESLTSSRNGLPSIQNLLGEDSKTLMP